MRTSSPSRRAAGLLAVTTIGFSTAVLSVTGVASATTTTTTTAFSTDPDAANVDPEYAGIFVLSTDGDCTITWDLVGAAGGKGYTGTDPTAGGLGGHYTATTTSTDGAAFLLRAGLKGEDGDPEAGAPGGGGYNGASPDWVSDGAEGYTSPGDITDPDDPAVYDDDVNGGGGGAASVVLTYDDEPYLGAFGGDGGLSDGTDGVGGLDGENENFAGATDAQTKTPSGTGDGVISGSMTCVTEVDPGPSTPPVDEEEESVTGAPIAKWVEGVERGLEFQLTTSTVNSPVIGVQYSFDGTHWADVATDNQGDYQYSGTIPGLEAGRTYSVAFRFTTADGPTAASETLTGTPLLSAPTDLRAAVGTSSILISWSPPAGADADAAAGYRAWAYPTGAQSDGDVVVCPELDAAARTCLLGVPAGTTYTVGAAATNGASAFLDTGVVVPAAAISATLPTSNGTLTSSDADGKVVAGEQITISGKDFLPGSTVELVVYSTPIKLGTAVVLADGTFSATVTLPKELANGVHHLVATGVDVNGEIRNMVVEVTVSGGTATVGLAYTGFSAAPFLGAGALALVAGGGLLVASRRRQA